MRIIRSIALALVVLMSLVPVKSAHAQDRSPRGWVGVAITTGIGQTNAAGAMVFNDYPVVESVDPGSPAQRAGIQAGDILISLNTQDLRRNPVPGISLLQPGQRILFRYKRNDETRTVTLIVAERPFGTSGHFALSIIGPAPTPGTRARSERTARDRATEVVVRERTADGMLPAVTLAPLILGPGAPSIVVAGAELTQLNDGLREALNVKGSGVFVVNVAIGTPAGESGLMSGDVIVRAEKLTLQNPGELVRLMRGAQENTLLLQVLRKRKPHTVTLRW